MGDCAGALTEETELMVKKKDCVTIWWRRV